MEVEESFLGIVCWDLFSLSLDKGYMYEDVEMNE